MKKLTLLQLTFCALVAFSSTQAIAGATSSDGTTTGTGTDSTTVDGTSVDGTTTVTPVIDDSDMATQGTADMNNSSMNDLNDDDGGDYGWIGLIGLAGLAGLMKRDRVDHTKTITR